MNCRYCAAPLEPQYTCVTRRVLTRVVTPGHKERVELHISQADQIAQYCNEACAAADEFQLADELNLKMLYPANSAIATCARCLKPIFRSFPHVSFNRLALTLSGLEDAPIAAVTDDIDLAFVCAACSAQEGLQVESETTLAPRTQRDRATACTGG